MSHIRSKDTSIELTLRKALWHKGYRYRKNYKGLPGTPDIVISKYRIAIFCDSEFFHGKDFEQLKLRLEKGNNSTYWIKKITRNIERDRDVDQNLRVQEWTVLRFWGKDITKHTQECIQVIEECIFEARTRRQDWDEPLQIEGENEKEYRPKRKRKRPVKKPDEEG